MKIGIISHYHGSLNYGGTLQAYALCKALAQYGVEAEQICLEDKNKRLPWEQKYKDLPLSCLLRKAVGRLGRRVRKTATGLLLPDLAQKRHRAFAPFRQDSIPHSSRIYHGGNIEECIGQYDAFITGSDQVWNLRWYHPAYFLTFAGEKRKFSYGASMALQKISDRERNLLREHLENFDGISVRESQTADMLKEVLGREVRWVLDPVLLLTKAQWDEVCAPATLRVKYLFCCFLGKAPGARGLAGKYARRHGLKIVTIPHLNGEWVAEDVGFGDIRMEAPSPEEFVSLIRYAECVFTDSFHATVFSWIYGRPYFIFPRHGSKEMDQRIYSLTALLESGDRFCDKPAKRKLEHLYACRPTDHTRTAAMAEMERCSRQYIENMLEMVKTGEKSHET